MRASSLLAGMVLLTVSSVEASTLFQQKLEQAVETLSPDQRHLYTNGLLDHSAGLRGREAQAEFRELMLEKQRPHLTPSEFAEASAGVDRFVGFLAGSHVMMVVMAESRARRVNLPSWFVAPSALLSELEIPAGLLEAHGFDEARHVGTDMVYLRSASDLSRSGRIHIFETRDELAHGLLGHAMGITSSGGPPGGPVVSLFGPAGEIFVQASGYVAFGRGNVMVWLSLPEADQIPAATELDELIQLELLGLAVSASVTEPTIVIDGELSGESPRVPDRAPPASSPLAAWMSVVSPPLVGQNRVQIPEGATSLVITADVFDEEVSSATVSTDGGPATTVPVIDGSLQVQVSIDKSTHQLRLTPRDATDATLTRLRPETIDLLTQAALASKRASEEAFLEAAMEMRKGGP